MTQTFKSQAFKSIHSSAGAMLEIDAIDKTTMREFDASCFAEAPAEAEATDHCAEA